MPSRDMNYASDERSPLTSPQGYSEFAFNGIPLHVRTDKLAFAKQQLHELLTRRPEAYHIELEEKLLTAETSLLEAENKIELLMRNGDMQTDRIERLENAVRALAPYEQFFRVITAMFRLPAFTSNLTPNGDINV